MSRPPGNSLDVEQEASVADRGDTVEAGLLSLLERIREELEYNDAKGATPFRLGVHDGLRFAEDAIVDLLGRHGHGGSSQPRELDA